jgi:hypothetical protein
MNLPVGYGEIDITPPLDVPYLGFEPRQGLFEGVHDPLLARAVVFGEGRDRLVLLVADALGFGSGILGPGRDFTAELRAGIAERTGIEPSNVMLTATHAHSTPETLGITRIWERAGIVSWLERLMDMLASAVVAALGDQEPCRLSAAAGRVPGLAHNRRPRCRDLPLDRQEEQGRLDASLQVLLCRDKADRPRIVLVNGQCHPVTLQVQSQVSADYPGVAVEMIRRGLPGCRGAIFIQGAAGNLNPLHDDSRKFRHARLYGAMVAGETMRLAARLMLTGEGELRSETVASISANVTVGPRELPDRQDCERRLREAQACADAAAGQAEQARAALELRRAREALDLVTRFSRPQEAEVQAFRISDLAVGAIPGELFTEWGLRIKRESPAAHTFVAELANGWVGYLVDASAAEEGGYETDWGTWTQTDADGAESLTTALSRLIGGLWA